MLDSVFIMPPDFTGSKYGGIIHEMREMQIMNFGQYAHGNQPIQHMVYLYNYTSQPWKTQYWVREIMDRLYNSWADGYCGDEDNGQTSAWYVFSAMGFYPVTPASTQYVTGTPYFKKVEITFENGKKLTINAPHTNKGSKYVSSLAFNSKPVTKNYFDHFELHKGGVINFGMSASPNRNRNTTMAAAPYSMSLHDK